MVRLAVVLLFVVPGMAVAQPTVTAPPGTALAPSAPSTTDRVAPWRQARRLCAIVAASATPGGEDPSATASRSVIGSPSASPGACRSNVS